MRETTTTEREERRGGKDQGEKRQDFSRGGKNGHIPERGPAELNATWPVVVGGGDAETMKEENYQGGRGTKRKEKKRNQRLLSSGVRSWNGGLSSLIKYVLNQHALISDV